jgi:hypothetical protein
MTNRNHSIHGGLSWCPRDHTIAIDDTYLWVGPCLMMGLPTRSIRLEKPDMRFGGLDVEVVEHCIQDFQWLMFLVMFVDVFVPERHVAG